MNKEETVDLEEGINLLRNLIKTPSFSNEEDGVAEIWEKWLKAHGVKNVQRFHNNVFALTEKYDSAKPILMLNSHLDTVRPVSSWVKDPFDPEIIDGKLYGLGSNDAGASGVALAITFLKYKDYKDLPFNLLLAITASEEKMGEYGMRSFLPYLRQSGIYPDMAIVGEPTACKAAIAERGLVVCDVIVKGKSGHAARDEGDNAIYKAIEDIESLKNIKWDKISNLLGPIKVSVTMINSGTQHNVVPDSCQYVVDIRTTDAYSNEETVEELKKMTKWSDFKPRSTRIHASALSKEHPLSIAAGKIGVETFVSPTTSDMALMYDIPSIKIGPGKSERSHSADEYIYLDELREGIEVYDKFLYSIEL